MIDFLSGIHFFLFTNYNQDILLFGPLSGLRCLKQSSSKSFHLKNVVFCTLKPGFSFFALFAKYHNTQLRSAPQSQLRRAAPCGAVPCRAVLCRAVLRAALYLLFRARQVSFDKVSYSSTEVRQTKFVRTSSLNHTRILPAQLSSAIAQQRAAQRHSLRKVPCLAVRCCAVLRCLSNTQHQVLSGVPRTRYRYVRVCELVRLLSSLVVPPLGPLRFLFEYYTLLQDQNVTSPAST